MSAEDDVHATLIEQVFQAENKVLKFAVDYWQALTDPVIRVGAMLGVIAVRAVHWPVAEGDYPRVFRSVLRFVGLLK